MISRPHIRVFAISALMVAAAQLPASANAQTFRDVACSPTLANPCTTPSTGTGSTPAMSPALEAAASQLGAALGGELRKLLFGNPAEAARRAELQRQQQAAEQARFAEEARLRDIRREEVFQRLAGALKLSGINTLAIRGFDGDRGELTLKGVAVDAPRNGDPLALKLGGESASGDNLRPQGTAAFGIGGGSTVTIQPEPNTDPMVVDLRDVQRSAFLVQSVETASIQDAPVLLDEALKAANGDESFISDVPAGAPPPAIDERGLLAFQTANDGYRSANDFELRLRGIFALAQQRRELADRITQAATADLEQAKASLADEVTLSGKHRLMAAIFAAKRTADSAWAMAEAEVLAARDRRYRAKEEAIRVLRATAASKDPAAFHPPIASLPDVDESTWMRAQAQMIASRTELDRQNTALQAQLKELRIPSPVVYERFHEGVILGAGTDAAGARAMYATKSAFSGQTPDAMNAAAERARERGIDGVGGAVVVSFGVPQDGTIVSQAMEGVRVLGDHLTGGQTSLNTAQGRESVALLSGKHFDRLVAHSNGASIAEALIQRDLITVNELNIVGGDRSLLNGHAFQRLIDSGKVKRVVVWVNVNDPIVWVTAADQLKLAQRGNDALEHIARKMTGELAGGDSRVSYRFMVGPGKGLFGPHRIETAYYKNIAPELGTP